MNIKNLTLAASHIPEESILKMLRSAIDKYESTKTLTSQMELIDLMSLSIAKFAIEAGGKERVDRELDRNEMARDLLSKD